MRLLLAEEETSLSKVLTAILEGNQCSVGAAYDGVEALAYRPLCSLYSRILALTRGALPMGDFG